MPLSYRQAGNTFIQGPNISIYPSGNSYAISASSTGGGSGTIISGRNVGTGTGVFCGLTTTVSSNDTLAFYNLSGGNEVGISINDDNEIVIVRGRTVVNTVSNLGGGAKVYTGITGTTLFARTISGAAGLTSALAGTGNILTRLVPTNTTANRFYIEDSTGVLTTNADFPIDATNGNISIDVAISTTSSLLLASGTSLISQLRLTPFSTELSSPTNGDIWYTTSGNTLKFYKNNISTDFIFKDDNISLTGLSNSILMADTAGTLSTKYINSFGIFNALSSVTIENTASETSIISPIITGSTTLLASTNAYNPELGVGRKFRFNAKGTIDTGDNVNLTIRIKLGSTVISSSSTISVGPIGDTYTSEIEIDATFTIRNLSLVIGSGKILFLTGPPSTFVSDPVIFGIYSQDTTISTTTDQIFDCTAQFDIADPSNTITINESTLEILN
jgi:hypothetical protein